MLQSYSYYIYFYFKKNSLRALAGGSASKLSRQLDLTELSGSTITLSLDSLTLLSHNELNVARRGHICINTTVSTVSPTATTLCLVHLNVSDNKRVNIKALDLSVRFSVV